MAADPCLPHADIRIVPMTLGDIPDALLLQAQSYPEALREKAAVFAARLAFRPCYCLTARRGGEMVGYLIAHPWERANPPAIGSLADPGRQADILYIHDLTIAAGARGLGMGERILARAFVCARADGLSEAELIAVEGAHTFWHRLGFREGHSPTIAAKTGQYGAQARWMRLETLSAR